MLCYNYLTGLLVHLYVKDRTVGAVHALQQSRGGIKINTEGVIGYRCCGSIGGPCGSIGGPCSSFGFYHSLMGGGCLLVG